MDRQDTQPGRTDVVVASSFTADLLRLPLLFWLESFSIDGSVTLAPYAQLLQELLSPLSSVSRNEKGYNVLLLRVEDWIRDRKTGFDVDNNIEHLGSVSREFIAAVASMRSRTNAPVVVFVAPASSDIAAVYARAVELIEASLLRELRQIANVQRVTHQQLSIRDGGERQLMDRTPRPGVRPYSPYIRHRRGQARSRVAPHSSLASTPPPN